MIRKLEKSVNQLIKNRSILKKPLEYLLYLKRRFRFIRYGWYNLIDNKMIIFESFKCRSFSDNPRAIFNELIENPAYDDFHFVWAFQNPNKYSELFAGNERVTLVNKGSRAYLRAYAQAKYWVNNASIAEYLKPRKGQIYIETWHGTPLKRICCDLIYDNFPLRSITSMKKKYLRVSRKITYMPAQSEFYKEKITSAFLLKDVNKEYIFENTGAPRNASLYKHDFQTIQQIKKQLDLPLDKKIILYTPTWRNTQYVSGKGFVYEDYFNPKLLLQELGEEYIILLRTHYLQKYNAETLAQEGVYDFTSFDDINDLYLISDMLITDYSSTMFDYSILRRPMLFYMYDKDEYTKSETGTYFDVSELPGPIVTEHQKLAFAIVALFENFVYDDKYQQFNQKFNQYDNKDSCSSFVERCIPVHENRFPCFAEEMEARKMLRLIYIPCSRGWRLIIRAGRLGKVYYRKVKKLLSIFIQCILHIGRIHGICRDQNTKKLYSYMNKYDGERCFIIGNGPSLTAADLDTLVNESSFGSNMIYKIYNDTKWRPTFHCTIDKICAQELAGEFKERIQCPLFTKKSLYHVLKEKPEDTIYVQDYLLTPYRVSKRFLSFYHPSDATVTSFILELAIHMGYKEIYLLGVDCTNTFSANGHFTKDYVSNNITTKDIQRICKKTDSNGVDANAAAQYSIEKSLYAYARLEEFSKKRGVKIYNATRGGDLEVFERIDFDKIIKK